MQRLNTIIAFLILLALALAAGCATSPGAFDPKAQITPPPGPYQNLRREQASTGSLFVDAGTDMYNDLRARRVGDLITVQIVENSKAKKKDDSKAERKNTYAAGIPNLMGYEAQFPFQRGDNKNPSNLVSANFQSKHDATAELTKEDTMTSAIGCTVMEVLPNGNLLVRGSRELQVNGETQYIVLQGTVRPSDVTTKNTVTSDQLADAKIHYTGRGVLSDKQQPGWLARLLDQVWPF
ncbi:MAG: flagellar basal body L-ring protein FlgH [Pseudomonadota bacterium]